MRWLLLLVYYLLWVIVRVAMRVFYPFTTVRNKAALQIKGPGIVVSNHPNTLLDPLQAVSRMRRQSFFLANAGLFDHPVANALLTRLYCIPVKRPGYDDKSRPMSVEESFAKCFEHFQRGGLLYIAPEGGSFIGRHLRPLKTGTARIALGYCASQQFKEAFHIVPVGLNYESPYYCGSRFMLQVASPINVQDWQAAYAADPVQAVKDLTAHLASQMASLLIDTRDEDEDALLKTLDQVQQNTAPLPFPQQWARSQATLAHLRTLPPTEYGALQALHTQYTEALKKHSLTDAHVASHERSAGPGQWLVALAGLPLWLYGRINNALPYDLTRWLERKLRLYPGYKATVKVLGGLLFFPLFYWLQYLLIRQWVPAPYAQAYAWSLPVSGILAWGYSYVTLPLRQGLAWKVFRGKNADEADQLLAARRALGRKY